MIVFEHPYHAIGSCGGWESARMSMEEREMRNIFSLDENNEFSYREINKPVELRRKLALYPISWLPSLLQGLVTKVFSFCHPNTGRLSHIPSLLHGEQSASCCFWPAENLHIGCPSQSPRYQLIPACNASSLTEYELKISSLGSEYMAHYHI
jgi:hypothetical protein